MKTHDYSLLIGRIYAVYGSKSSFAEAMGMRREKMYSRINNQQEWTQDEIGLAMDKLDIPKEEVYSYFFS